MANAVMDVDAEASHSKPDATSLGLTVPWVEKYRPMKTMDVVGNEEAVGRLRVIARDGNLPNMIITGPPGTGKTTSVCCLARELLGDQYKNAVLELNASDDRNLEVVRGKIKMFAQKKVSLPPGRHKLIILDEADSMTPAAQQALRRTMELFSATTRFALACNWSNKVIEPIQSRCAILRFTKLSDQDVLERVMHVIEAEGVPHTEDGLEAILYTAEGDLRNALNNLQATMYGFGIVNADNVFKVCDQPHPVIVEELVQFCLAGQLASAQKKLNALLNKGYSAVDIITTFFKVVSKLKIDEKTQLEFIKRIGECHVRIVEGVSTPLQLGGLLARMCKYSREVLSTIKTV
jgi:replication factor C subunit 2/4|mmetsp:Transcript_34857/g.58247  ORF Transcript_34857/g.58247 Transcript_34857/m.58247 type:complete len:349 (+) Transcript_34857:43-1089(+)|eukprot:CAMPEP_0174287700 /NCGR_PEP_ID=MMETSP0809-20121228/17078_1 /TAXON_ID=73025 ORGANISM="Eutreptiella gymnastica-like, Strain CCMP1594" /NCGR_SAMPLE_ID=MMETSP0809 /ASSEMBLY_ACC=CAM_ASM_000658 /LENGTH=348 /DNA_ID=CAMNT_0015384399 /DNA_START=43 /DNA_END=1089 /DNA_ORIENTATION=+